jgi:hypothetical protein
MFVLTNRFGWSYADIEQGGEGLEYLKGREIKSPAVIEKTK